MRSQARIVARATAAPDEQQRPARLVHLAGEGALTVRATSTARRARVHLVAGAFGPLGGDELCLEIVVEPGAELEVAASAATIVQRSRDGRPSRMDVRIDVGAGGRLTLTLPPMVVTAGAHHTVETRVTLAEGADLLLREETIRGRTGEAGGAALLRIRVDVGEAPVLQQELELSGTVGGPWAPRAVGSLLMLGKQEPGDLQADPTVRAAWMKLACGAGHQLSALSDDPLALGRLLDDQLPR